MRKLTKKQKSLLYQWFRQSKKRGADGIYDYTLKSWYDLTINQIEELEKINDTEILYQEVNRYLNDLVWERFRAEDVI